MARISTELISYIKQEKSSFKQLLILECGFLPLFFFLHVTNENPVSRSTTFTLTLQHKP